MIEISFAKLVLLALVALIVLGPEKLPGAARTAGALLRRVRNGWDSVRSEVERELEVEEIRRAAREAAARAEAAQAEFRAATADVEAAVAQAGAEVKAAVTPPSPIGDGGGMEEMAPVLPAASGEPDAAVSVPVGGIGATVASVEPAAPAMTVKSDMAAGPAAEAFSPTESAGATAAEPDPQQELPLPLPRAAAKEPAHGGH